MTRFLAGLLAVAFAGLIGCATPLQRAAQRGDQNRVRALLAAGARSDGVATSSDLTPLMLAAMRGHIEPIRLLLDNEANVNAQSPAGHTALYFAAVTGRTEVVKLLLERGADARAVDRRGKDAEAAALSRRHTDTAEVLRKWKAERGGSMSPPPARDLATGRRTFAESASSTQRLESDIDSPRHVSPENPDDFAVVVGVESYAHELPKADFAERDAEAVRRNLISLGYPSRHVKVLTNALASKSALQAVLEDWLKRNVKEDSRVFFYFSGHGAPDPTSGKAYLVPFDGDPEYLTRTALPLAELYADLDKLPAKQVVVALDSCFSGAGGRSVLAHGARPLVNKIDAAPAEARNTVVFSAASGDEITGTLDDQGHGLFTYYFLKGLAGAAADKSGQVTASGLNDYLKPKVRDEASLHNRDQTPQLFGAAEGQVLSTAK
ncbi:MAG: ankyrin repeat domain-containing protein [Elusimicrobia bacterium]|nr:ankyrin repeat domain-containing protein [Elusimicrobiota bacterium]